MATFDARLDDDVVAHESAALVHDVDTFDGWFHEYADIVTSGISPGLASVNVLSPTSIRVNFSRPAVKNAALLDPNNYVITPTLAVHSVAAAAGTTAAYVDLVIDEQCTGTAYDLELQRIEAA